MWFKQSITQNLKWKYQIQKVSSAIPIGFPVELKRNCLSVGLRFKVFFVWTTELKKKD